MSTRDVFPQPNLGKDSMPWARGITAATFKNKLDLDMALAELRGGNRAAAGQMGSAGRQIAAVAAQTSELDSRLTSHNELATVTVTTPENSNAWVSATTGGFISGVGQGRNAIVSVHGAVTADQNMAGPFVTITFDNSVVFRGTVGPFGGQLPPGWSNSLTATFAVTVPAEGARITIMLQSSSFVSQARTASVITPGITTLFTDRTMV